MRRLLPIVLLVLVATSCGGRDVDISAIPEIPAVNAPEIQALIANSEVPVVVNVWASWCVPCRSEAPLLAKAAENAGEEVLFIGLNVRDDQDGARSFIAEFFPNAAIEHLFDAGGNVPLDLGASRAVPLTFFYGPGGQLVELHSGVIDERTLALLLDEIKTR